MGQDLGIWAMIWAPGPGSGHMGQDLGIWRRFWAHGVWARFWTLGQDLGTWIWAYRPDSGLGQGLGICDKSEGIRANPHACNIYYKTALPVPCTHRFFFKVFLVTCLLHFWMSLLGRFLEGSGGHFGSILEPTLVIKPSQINNKSFKNEGQISTPKCIRFLSKIK